VLLLKGANGRCGARADRAVDDAGIESQIAQAHLDARRSHVGGVVDGVQVADSQSPFVLLQGELGFSGSSRNALLEHTALIRDEDPVAREDEVWILALTSQLRIFRAIPDCRVTTEPAVICDRGDGFALRQD
jgi:hypothetical protein